MEADDKFAALVECQRIGHVYDLATNGEAVQIIINRNQVDAFIAKLRERADPGFCEWFGFAGPVFHHIEAAPTEGKFGYSSCGTFSYGGDGRLVLIISIPKGPDKGGGMGLAQLNTFSEVFCILAHLRVGETTLSKQLGCIASIRPVQIGTFRQAIAFKAIASYEFACWIAREPDTDQAEGFMRIANLRILGKKRLPRSQDGFEPCSIHLGKGQIDIVCTLFDGTGGICTLGKDWDDDPKHPWGLEATSHNLDTIRQALVVLVGFAGIWQDAQASLAQSQSP